VQPVRADHPVKTCFFAQVLRTVSVPPYKNL